jgi:N-acyl-L-homoserine lactone synthetase
MTWYGVILFHTNSSVMRAEKLLKRAGYSIKIIPTPREFSSDCGVALRFDWTDCEQVKLILDTAHLEIDAIHQM